MNFEKRRLILRLAAAASLWPASAWSVSSVEGHRLSLGVVSERANQPDYVLTQYALLLDYLRLRLAPQGIVVGELRVARDLAELAGFVRAGEVDVILESMMSTFRVNAAGAVVEPVLAAWRKGRRETSTVFFVRQSSRIRYLSDLAGKRLVLESPRSTTAYTLPRIVLRQHGLSVQPLGSSLGGASSVRYVLADSEENQAYWVDRGRADAGAFNTEDWEALPRSLRQELRIIHITDPILRWLLSARPDLSPTLLATLQAAFTEMDDNPEGVQALLQAGRIRRFDRLTREDQASFDNWRAVALRWRFGE